MPTAFAPHDQRGGSGEAVTGLNWPLGEANAAAVTVWGAIIPCTGREHPNLLNDTRSHCCVMTIEGTGQRFLLESIYFDTGSVKPAEMKHSVATT